MKRMYWRPRRVSRTALVLISVGSMSGYFGLERTPTVVQEPHYQEKLAASQLALTAFKAIKEERLRRKLPIDPESDPALSGIIGSLVTTVTTNAGSLPAKQTSINPNFAAIIVQWIKDANLSEGDTVAVGYSGSFPAFNMCVLAAIETLGLKPIIIASATASQWGANEPDFLWIDMEQFLVKKKIFSHKTIAASVGGIEDRGLGMTKKGRRIVVEAIEKHGLPIIDPVDFTDSVNQRMRIYRQHAGASPIRAYINVGGGAISVGRKHGKKLLVPGLNLKPPMSSFPTDSVVGRFLQDNVPVIHLIQVAHLAEHFGFPQPPELIAIPPVGHGKIFYRERTNTKMAVALLCAILGALYLFVRSDIGFRMTRRQGGGSDHTHPEPMV